MAIWQELRNWVSAKLAVRDSVALPVTGQSSRDEKLDVLITKFLSANEDIAPGINFDTIRCLKTLWISHPTLAQAVNNLQALANTGHEVNVESKNAEAVAKRLTETAQRVYPNSYGIDGLVNDAIAQVVWSGAFSREDVVDLEARQIRKVVLVPPEQIRFRAVDHEWTPYQYLPTWLGRGGVDVNGIPLHPTTYRYYALSRVDNSPYAKPPFTAALERILKTQTNMLNNLDAIVEKLGLLGLFSVEVVPPPRKSGQESEEEYQSRAKRFLTNVREVFEKNPSKNLMVTFRDQKVTHTSTTGDARGASDLYTLNRQEITQGLFSMPAFHGLNDTTTETFADVVWYILQAQAQNVQRVVKRGIERTYQLDLILGGIDAAGLSVRFNPIRSRNMLQEAQADQVRQQIIFSDYEKGMIDGDTAAQQRGYDKAHDPKRLDNGAQLVTLSFNRQRGTYEYQPEVISLSPKKKDSELMSESEINALLDEFIDNYLSKVMPIAKRAKDVALELLRDWLTNAQASDYTAESFAKEAIQKITTAYGVVFDSIKTKRIVGDTIKAIYRYYRLQDDVPFGTEGAPIQMKFGAPDRRAVEWFGETENFYFSKYVNNADAELKKFFNDEFLSKGKALFGNESSVGIEALRKAAGGKLDNVNDRGVQIIVRNGVQRARNYANINAMHQAEIEEAEYIAVLDKRTSHICETLHGKKIRIGVAAAAVDELTQLEPGDYAQRMFESAEGKAMRVANTDAEAAAKYFKSKLDGGYVKDDFVSSGLALPPLHPSCRTRLIVVV